MEVFMHEAFIYTWSIYKTKIFTLERIPIVHSCQSKV